MPKKQEAVFTASSIQTTLRNQTLSKTSPASDCCGGCCESTQGHIEFCILFYGIAGVLIAHSKSP
jgi:hypothetical protein